MVAVYNYAWFVGFALAAVVYMAGMRLFQSKMERRGQQARINRKIVSTYEPKKCSLMHGVEYINKRTGNERIVEYQ
eukprot:6419978-Pyramimonas_sp.AAC.1